MNIEAMNAHQALEDEQELQAAHYLLGLRNWHQAPMDTFPLHLEELQHLSPGADPRTFENAKLFNLKYRSPVQVRRLTTTGLYDVIHQGRAIVTGGLTDSVLCWPQYTIQGTTMLKTPCSYKPKQLAAQQRKRELAHALPCKHPHASKRQKQASAAELELSRVEL